MWCVFKMNKLSVSFDKSSAPFRKPNEQKPPHNIHISLICAIWLSINERFSLLIHSWNCSSSVAHEYFNEVKSIEMNEGE